MLFFGFCNDQYGFCCFAVEDDLEPNSTNMTVGVRDDAYSCPAQFSSAMIYGYSYHFTMLEVTIDVLDRPSTKMVWRSDPFVLTSFVNMENKSWTASPELINKRNTTFFSNSYSSSEKHKNMLLGLSVGLSLGTITLIVAIWLGVRLWRRRITEENKEYRKPELDAKDVPRPMYEKDSNMLHEMEAERVRGMEHELNNTRSPVEADGPEPGLVDIVERSDDAGREG